jgi:hypothetical protein
LALAKELPQPNAWLFEHVGALQGLRRIGSERLWYRRAPLAALLATQTLSGVLLAACTIVGLSCLVPKVLSHFGSTINETAARFLSINLLDKLAEIITTLLQHLFGAP